MAKIVIRVPEEILVRARARARRERTSLTLLLRKRLQEYGGVQGASPKAIRAAMKRVLEASAKFHGKIKGRRFDRAEIYERGPHRGA